MARPRRSEDRTLRAQPAVKPRSESLASPSARSDGADRDRKGAFESANGGTLFLDEIGECDQETQAKLLRVLQPLAGAAASVRSIRRLGDQREIKVNVRLIAATNRDLHRAIAAGTFREDLFYRLATLSIRLPALRDRRSDIPQIAEKLLTLINRQFAAEEPSYSHKSLSVSAIAFVKQQPWPGNVRQLSNTLVQAAAPFLLSKPCAMTLARLT